MNSKKDTPLQAFVNVVKEMTTALFNLINDDLIDSTMPAPIMAQAINQRKSNQFKPAYVYNYDKKQ